MNMGKQPTPVVLTSDDLEVVVLPEVGFKIRSLYFKPKRFEALFQPKALTEASEGELRIPPKEAVRFYRTAFPGAPFEEYDTSGLDDCIPTIDACEVEGANTPLNDHGDAWSREWTLIDPETREPIECPEGPQEAVSARLKLSSMDLSVERAVRLKNNVMELSYRLENVGTRPLPWLWALHGLFRHEPDAILEFSDPVETAVNVHDDRALDFDRTRLAEYEENDAYKFYFPKPVSRGEASVIYPSQGVRVRYLYDEKELPYLGVWITTGGFKGEKNIAVEPCNGYYDKLDRAVENETARRIEPNEVQTWSVRIALEPYEEIS